MKIALLVVLLAACTALSFALPYALEGKKDVQEMEKCKSKCMELNSFALVQNHVRKIRFLMLHACLYKN